MTNYSPTIKIFSDGADLNSLLEMAKNPIISGFTTNPTLMKKAWITDYQGFAKSVLEHIQDRPISFEVFADDFENMKRQALLISSWGKNVFVKIPITNTKGESSLDLVKELSDSGVQINLTAILTMNQVRRSIESLKDGAPSVISVFAGRIADTGRDPWPMMKMAKEEIDFSGAPNIELLWASPRELLNIKQAEECGTNIITVPPDMLKKMSLFGKDLSEYSLETVKMFHDDAKNAGYKL